MSVTYQAESLEFESDLDDLFGVDRQANRVSVKLDFGWEKYLKTLRSFSGDTELNWRPDYEDICPEADSHFNKIWSEVLTRTPGRYRINRFLADEREIAHKPLWRLIADQAALAIYMLDGPRGHNEHSNPLGNFADKPFVRAVLVGNLLPTGEISLNYFDQACPNGQAWQATYAVTPDNRDYTYAPLLVAGTMFYCFLRLLLIEQEWPNSMEYANWDRKLAIPYSLERTLESFFQTHWLSVNFLLSATGLMSKENF